jgi:predicted DNA-binding protein
MSRDVYERLNYIQKDIARNKEKLDEHETMIKEMEESFGEDFKEQLAHTQKKFE